MLHISWDTAGPTKTKSINGYHYTTYWGFGQNSTAQIPELFDKLYADTAPLRDKPGPILSVRRDRATVNISAALEKHLVQLKRPIHMKRGRMVTLSELFRRCLGLPGQGCRQAAYLVVFSFQHFAMMQWCIRQPCQLTESRRHTC